MSKLQILTMFLIIFFIMSAFCMLILKAIIVDGKKKQTPIKVKGDVKKPLYSANKGMNNIKQKIRYDVLTPERINVLDLMLVRAGVKLRPEEFFIINWACLLFTVIVLFLITRFILILPIAALVGYFTPLFIIQAKKDTRLKKFHKELPNLLTMLIGSLRSGFSFMQALTAVADDSEEVMKEELNIVIKELKIGRGMEEVFDEWYQRVPIEDLNLMLHAVVIQKETGGNLTTILESILNTIKEKISLHRKLSALTAQGKISGIIMTVLPIVIGILSYLVDREHASIMFTHPLGKLMLASSVSGMVACFFIMRKMTRMEV
ncbi:UNVERIFIED_CONTAM: tight adherence protein B [Acetivibrio alkalicellulosi]